MLVQFKVGNYLSFNDIATFSMVASVDKEHLDSNTLPVNNKLRLLKSAVIYGANGSGKSNLLEAMNFMKGFVLNSLRGRNPGGKIPLTRFLLSTESERTPASFEMVFYVGDIRYRYGFQLNEDRVEAEWLFFVPTTREATLFVREQDRIKTGPRFKEGHGLENKTRADALFLSVVEQFNGETAGKILRWFEDFKIIFSLDNYSDELFALSHMKNEEIRDFSLKFLKAADTGIQGFSVDSSPIDLENFPYKVPKPLHDFVQSKLKGKDRVRIRTLHKKYDANKQPVSDEFFDFDLSESTGTHALFTLSVPLYFALKNNHVLVIDEFTSKLHPLLARAVLDIVHSEHTGGKNFEQSRSQLFFVSHDTNILSSQYFRRDQIWFTEKSEYGDTELYSLYDYKVRKDAFFSKDYIRGKYGAVPFIGAIESLFD